MLAHLKILDLKKLGISKTYTWISKFSRYCWQCWHVDIVDTIDTVDSVDNADNADNADNVDNVDNIDNVDNVESFTILRLLTLLTWLTMSYPVYWIVDSIWNNICLQLKQSQKNQSPDNHWILMDSVDILAIMGLRDAGASKNTKNPRHWDQLQMEVQP